MFGKKLLAAVLSMGLLSVCSMGALAGTVSGSGMSSGDPEGYRGAVAIDYRITTNANIQNTVVSKMMFMNADSSMTSCYIDSTVYLEPENPADPLISVNSSGGTVSWMQDEDHAGWMQCVLGNYFVPSIVEKIDSTFHYTSSAHGSFTGGLTKYGF